MGFSAKQTEQLLKPVNPRRVQRDNNGQSHLAGYDVSAHLTRLFGFGGWEKHITSLELVAEEGVKSSDGKRTGWYVTYKCQMTLEVKDPSGAVIWANDDGATGSAQNIPQRGEAHDFALKNAITYALKRCAKDLGDQFGLSLYNKGSLKPLVGQVLTTSEADVDQALPDEMHPDTDDAAPAADTREGAEPAPPRRGSVNGHGRQAPPDDPVLFAWAAKIDEITDMASAMTVRDELGATNLDAERKEAIGRAIDAKLATLGTGQRPTRPRGPSAQERGAQPVPVGKGDDGEWVQGFLARLKDAATPDDLDGFQAQIGNAVRAKTISPAKSAELSKALRDRRNELEQVPA